MEEKKYLKWYNKVGYGSGDIAGNVVYAFLTSFVMVYLTDTVGLASGIVGTLIAVSKLFDGFTDILAVRSRWLHVLQFLPVWVSLHSIHGFLLHTHC